MSFYHIHSPNFNCQLQVSCKAYLTKIQKADFNIFHPTLRERNHLLPLLLLKHAWTGLQHYLQEKYEVQLLSMSQKMRDQRLQKMGSLEEKARNYSQLNKSCSRNQFSRNSLEHEIMGYLLQQFWVLWSIVYNNFHYEE